MGGSLLATGHNIYFLHGNGPSASTQSNLIGAYPAPMATRSLLAKELLRGVPRLARRQGGLWEYLRGAWKKASTS